MTTIIGGSSPSITFSDSTTQTTAFTTTPTINTITSSSATALTLQSAGTTAVTVTTAQLVGVGTTSPSAKLHVTQSGNPIAQFTRSDSGTGLVIASDSDGPYFRPETSSAIRFNNSANTVEYMRVDSSGNVLVGTTSVLASASNSLQVKGAGNPAFFGVTNNGDSIVFRNASNTTSGTIAINASTVSYNTSSDYRLKEDIAPMSNALAKVSALKPVTYKWKSDGSAGEGFIAHELAEIVSDCVTGEKDAVDAEGNPKYQGIDTSFLVATLTAAIQELNAKVDAQAAEIAELKAKS